LPISPAARASCAACSAAPSTAPREIAHAAASAMTTALTGSIGCPLSLLAVEVGLDRVVYAAAGLGDHVLQHREERAARGHQAHPERQREQRGTGTVQNADPHRILHE